jgi:hypothetical protein
MDEEKEAELRADFLRDIKLEVKLMGKGKYYPSRESFDGYHWEVTLHYAAKSLTTLFSMGTAHAYEAQVPRDPRDEFLEDGHDNTLRKFAQAPQLAEVLSSLRSDADVDIDFDAFCDSFGYSNDSRRAERIHQGCLKIKLQLQDLMRTRFDDFMSVNFDE